MKKIHISTFEVAPIYSTFCSVNTGGRTDCGAVLTGNSDVIGSPDQDGDGHYENLVNCLWIIQMHDDNVIVFDVLEMDIQMESSNEILNCRADYLEVFMHLNSDANTKCLK